MDHLISYSTSGGGGGVPAVSAKTGTTTSSTRRARKRTPQKTTNATAAAPLPDEVHFPVQDHDNLITFEQQAAKNVNKCANRLARFLANSKGRTVTSMINRQLKGDLVVRKTLGIFFEEKFLADCSWKLLTKGKTVRLCIYINTLKAIHKAIQLTFDPCYEYDDFEKKIISIMYNLPKKFKKQ